MSEDMLSFTEEKTVDGGEVRLRNQSCYQDFIGILISNGYEVTIRVDDFGNELIIHFKKER